MAEGILEIDDNSFETEVLKSDLPVLVDFWAPWCGPCRAMGPAIEEVARAYAGKLKVAKCNVDDNPITPGKFEIRSIPTLIFFKAGKAVDQIVGMVNKSRLDDVIVKLV